MNALDINRYKAYARWDWAVNMKFYISFGLIIVGVVLCAFIIYVVGAIDNVKCGVGTMADVKHFDIFVFVYFALISAMFFIFHSYRTKTNRVLTMGLPVSRWARLLHNFLALYLVCIASLIVSALLCDLLYHLLPLLGYGDVDDISLSARMLLNVINGCDLFALFMFFVLTFVVFLVNTFVYRNNIIWSIIASFVVCVAMGLFNSTVIDPMIINDGLWSFEQLELLHNLQCLFMAIVSAALLIWGLIRYNKHQLVTRFSH